MKVVWTRPACSDLESIRDYIARDSEPYAARYVGRILAAVRRLETFPELGEVLLHVDSGPTGSCFSRTTGFSTRCEADTWRSLRSFMPGEI